MPRLVVLLCLLSSAFVHSQDAASNLRKDGLQQPVDNKIVGGEPVDISQAPYQVSLQYRGSHICGGSILRANKIVTAAHCVTFERNLRASDFRIRAGSTRHDQGGQLRTARSISVHPNYDSRTLNYDFAVVTLSSSITADSKAMRINLTRTEPPPGAETFVTGWGTTSENGQTSQTLRGARIPVISRSKCSEQYRNQATITQQMFCAALEEGGVDSCQGDSGGPSIYRSQLVGVVSYGVGCARKDKPGVYANVASQYNWLMSQ